MQVARTPSGELAQRFDPFDHAPDHRVVTVSPACGERDALDDAVLLVEQRQLQFGAPKIDANSEAVWYVGHAATPQHGCDVNL